VCILHPYTHNIVFIVVFTTHNPVRTHSTLPRHVVDTDISDPAEIEIICTKYQQDCESNHIGNQEWQQHFHRQGFRTPRKIKTKIRAYLEIGRVADRKLNQLPRTHADHDEEEAHTGAKHRRRLDIQADAVFGKDPDQPILWLWGASFPKEAK